MEPRDPNQITFFGQTNFRGEARRFGIKRDDRRRHMYVIGKTGMGKSTMLENMIIQDIQNGEGIAVVDPHGDLVEKVIDFIPEDRIDDVIYFNPADLHFPIAFNIVEQVEDEYKNLIANGLVGVFKKIWADSWGPRLEYILINTILSLLDYPGATLLDVTRVLVDANYRKKVIKKIKDPIVRSFWINEYNNYTEKFRNEAIAPIQNKVGQFLSSALIRNIVGQEHSTIDVRKEMDAGKILLMNLSKGRIGEENAALLGAMMITRIQLAAMSRVDIPEHERRDFFLYVDEFQNFSTESFASILSEARKYRLNITMAHQYIEQLSDEVRAAVFGNVGSMVTFRVGATDAEELEKEYQPVFTQEDIVKLPSYHVYLRLMIDGVASDPFSATTLPPISEPYGLRDQIIEASRQKYAKSRTDVEHSIELWAAVDENQAKKIQEKREKQMERERQNEQQQNDSGKEEGQQASKQPQKPRSRNGIPLPVQAVEEMQENVKENLHEQKEAAQRVIEKGVDAFHSGMSAVDHAEEVIRDKATHVEEVIEERTDHLNEEVREKVQKVVHPIREKMHDANLELQGAQGPTSFGQKTQEKSVEQEKDEEVENPSSYDTHHIVDFLDAFYSGGRPHVEEGGQQQQQKERGQKEKHEEEAATEPQAPAQVTQSPPTKQAPQRKQSQPDQEKEKKQISGAGQQSEGGQKKKRKRRRKRKKKSGGDNVSQHRPEQDRGKNSEHQPFKAALQELQQQSEKHQDRERRGQSASSTQSQQRSQPQQRPQSSPKHPQPIQPGQHITFD